MNGSPRSISPLDSPLAGSPTTSNSPTLSSAEGGEEVTIFEGYLHKIPPLKKSLLMVKWSKRWFVLKKSITADNVIFCFCYYKDVLKRGKPHQIDLTKITGIIPSPKNGSSGHIFAVETDERKYILKATDQHVKNIWLAKLCELCGQEVVYHVTIPNQPCTTHYNEAILKFSTANQVTFATPSSNGTLFSIPYSDIRRLGMSFIFGCSIVWFEICRDSRSDQFFFVVISAGCETAKQIVQELKIAIQTSGRPLILEDSANIDVSYIIRNHYGCQEFPQEARNQIMQLALYRIPLLSPCASPSSSAFLSNRFFQAPPVSPALSDRVWRDTQSGLGEPGGVGGVSLEEFGRRKTFSSRVPSSASLTRRPTLDKFVRQNSASSFDRQLSVSSFDHSPLTRTTSDADSPSLPRSRHNTEAEEDGDRSDGHFSSSSGSDVFESSVALNPSSFSKRKLSLQSSTSSQNSTHGHASHSPPIMEEILTETFDFDGAADSVPMGPVVPPRSVISLKEEAHFAKMTTAH